MREPSRAVLRSSFDGLSGADTSSTGKFVQFYRGETFTLVRFGGQILAEQGFRSAGSTKVDAMGSLGTDQFDDHTALWSALDHAYQLASGLAHGKPSQSVTIVLMTDGLDNAGIGLDDPSAPSCTARASTSTACWSPISTSAVTTGRSSTTPWKQAGTTPKETPPPGSAFLTPAPDDEPKRRGSPWCSMTWKRTSKLSTSTSSTDRSPRAPD